ncbi:hypothetical protein CEUSTIGMA_g13365.t1 [Chlamydomonas eustigma]|uniref:Uncharacterized protein n=1 Tax=Chlamydomonas eustigma TaxID=1157962 RepID=A0A250XSL3_9CHLO|nr:hypothetical protein CEUSTIGMA_g13365.t1 [Chlamydomonas eustigma]|eukprot:GAX85949.1 hypothetical protein CEUSTIGMA_g13365.t1 [Chlamydomonas eustigma]
MGCSDSKESSTSSNRPRYPPNASGSQKGTFASKDASSSRMLRQVSAHKRESADHKAEIMFLVTKGQRFYDNYVRPTLVSYGATCKVLTAYHRETQKKYAVKTIPKTNRNAEVQRSRVLKEVGVLKEVEDHPNAVKLHEVYDEAQNYYLVMECCDGGELFEHIAKGTEAFTERHAANILKSLMLFLAHMHSKGIAHMDIKPENIMFDAEGTNGVVKIIDFGAAQYVQPDETINDAFGTVRYSSPEMAADSGIGQKTDVWSAGALMYFMLSGSAPFLKKDDIDTLNYIKKKPKVKFSGKRWAAISEDAKDCILAMLEVDPSHRPTSQQILQMAWLRSVAHTAPSATNQQDETSIRRDILDHLRAFANQSRMRRLLLGLMASSISGGEANKLLDHFYAMDSDFSGTIEMKELASVAKQVLPDLTEEEVCNLFSALDLNHTGTVDVKEFFASLLQTMDPDNQIEVARRSFCEMDRDRRGFLSKKVFMDEMVRQAVISGMGAEDAAQLEVELEAEFRALDANSDGQLSFEEFQAVLGLEGSVGSSRVLDVDRRDPGTVAEEAGGSMSQAPPAVSFAGTPAVAARSSRQSTAPDRDSRSRSGIGASVSTGNLVDSNNLVQLALKIRDRSRAQSMASQADCLRGVNEVRQDSDEVESDQGGATTGQQSRATSVPEDGASNVTPGGGVSVKSARLMSAGKNPAAASAAAVTAAVAAAFAAGPPLDDAVWRHDPDWPRAPGASSVKLAHTLSTHASGLPSSGIGPSHSGIKEDPLQQSSPQDQRSTSGAKFQEAGKSSVKFQDNPISWKSEEGWQMSHSPAATAAASPAAPRQSPGMQRSGSMSLVQQFVSRSSSIKSTLKMSSLSRQTSFERGVGSLEPLPHGKVLNMSPILTPVHSSEQVKVDQVMGEDMMPGMMPDNIGSVVSDCSPKSSVVSTSLFDPKFQL